MRGCQSRLEQIKSESYKATLDAETTQHKTFHETVQGEIKSEDWVVRRTRPVLAFVGYLATSWYVIFHPSPSWEIASILILPVTAYITGRSVEKVKGRAGPMMGLGAILPGRKV